MSLQKHITRGSVKTCLCCGFQTDLIYYHYAYLGNDSSIYHCEQCGFEFLRPLSLKEVDDRRMESVNDAEMFHSPFLKSLHQRFIIAPEISKVRKLLGRNSFKMLDVGCGTGWISRLWADSGARVTGLEPSQVRAVTARERGLRVLSCYAEELSTDEHFDLIVIRHVIEHLEDPAAILQSLASRLTPDGLILLVVPNIDCIGRKVFDADWTWVLPWHCNFFNPGSIQTLLKNCGYSIAKSYQTPSPLWYPESFRKKYPRIGNLIGRGPVSMALFAPLIGYGYLAGLSDNITIFAQLEKSNGT
jgi:SAM-dependent methyltransferase